jgi:hypothetical protein
MSLTAAQKLLFERNTPFTDLPRFCRHAPLADGPKERRVCRLQKALLLPVVDDEVGEYAGFHAPGVQDVHEATRPGHRHPAASVAIIDNVTFPRNACCESTFAGCTCSPSKTPGPSKRPLEPRSDGLVRTEGETLQLTVSEASTYGALFRASRCDATLLRSGRGPSLLYPGRTEANA